MNYKLFFETFSALADHWDALGSPNEARALLELITAGQSGDLKNSVALAEKLRKIVVVPASNGDHDIQPLVHALHASQLLFQKLAKKAIIDDINLILNELERLKSMSLDLLISKLRESMRPPRASDHAANGKASLSVSEYIKQLENTVGSAQEFTAVFNQLKNDPEIKQPDMVVIASTFAFKMSKSTSKKAALARIWEQHQVSESTGAKIRASDGRSAA